MKDAGALVIVGILGVAVVAFLLMKDKKKSNQGYQYHPQKAEPPLPSPFFDSHSQVVVNLPLYENDEHWEIKRGPDRLIEEIVIKRKVIANA